MQQSINPARLEEYKNVISLFSSPSNYQYSSVHQFIMPPSATDAAADGLTSPKVSSQEAGAANAKIKMPIPRPPVFEDKLKEREYLKGRLAAAFRIFGKNGYDEGIPSTTRQVPIFYNNM